MATGFVRVGKVHWILAANSRNLTALQITRHSNSVGSEFNIFRN